LGKKVSFSNLDAHVLDVGASSKKDMTLSLKVKSAAESIFNFDFDEPDEDEEWLGREPINALGGRLARVRCAPDSRRIVA
jgi:hypothetical protein